MEKLHIVTRCTRIKNLLAIKDSILLCVTFKIYWHIIFDTNVLKDVDVDLLSQLYSEQYTLDLRFVPSNKGAFVVLFIR